MAEECVVAVYKDTLKAKAAIDKLIASGFPQTNVSLVTATLKNEPAEVKRALELGDESGRDGMIGAGIGGVIGLLGGGTVVTLAGTGVFIAGPLGAAAGAVVGGLIGAIRGWSVHKDHIPRYEEKIKSGHVLVLAHGSDPVAVAAAEKTLYGTQPLEVHLHAAVDDADDPRVDDLGK
jgi:outer membrane lipoprotein SlyB